MANLLEIMPPIEIDQEALVRWGELWLSEINTETGKSKKDKCFDKKQSMSFGRVFDNKVAHALAEMLGNIPMVDTVNKSLIPPESDCVEVGDVRVIGGVRPQNFDVVYRPDGLRIAFDSKTLNDFDSVKKNWQNMINDLATEATTVHTRFPYAIVAFLVAIPKPALAETQAADIVRTLERLGTRNNVLNQVHLAESISLVVWHPETGTIDSEIPNQDSILRIEKFSSRLFPHYLERYKGLPPHN
jgi:hypothetical protein